MNHAIKTDRYDVNSPEKLAGILNEAGRIVPVFSGSVFRLDDDTQFFSSVTGNDDVQLNRKFQTLLDEGIIDWAVIENKILVLEDFDYVPGSFSGEQHSFVISPFESCGSEKLILLIHCSKPKSEFTARDIKNLEKLTGMDKRY